MILSLSFTHTNTAVCRRDSTLSTPYSPNVHNGRTSCPHPFSVFLVLRKRTYCNPPLSAPTAGAPPSSCPRPCLLPRFPFPRPRSQRAPRNSAADSGFPPPKAPLKTQAALCSPQIRAACASLLQPPFPPPTLLCTELLPAPATATRSRHTAPQFTNNGRRRFGSDSLASSAHRRQPCYR